MKPLRIAIASLLIGASAAACSNEVADDGTLTVAVALHPIEEIARRVGGDNVEIISLVPAGHEAHEYEPTAQQLARLESADLFIYLGSDFQPNLQHAIKSLPTSVRRVDLLVDAPLYGLSLIAAGDDVDPHVWLDPQNMASMAAAVAAAFRQEAPQMDDEISSNEVDYQNELNALNADFSDGLADCPSPVLITTHRAFSYLANAFGLDYRAIAGVSPGDEPSAKALEELTDFAAQQQVTTIFAEENLPPELAATVASEIGGRIAPLATVESLTQAQLDNGESYNSLMKANLETLRAGLGCV